MWSINILIISGCILVLSSSLPANIKQCHVGEVQCISKRIEEILHMNPNGLKELGLPNMEPYRLNELILSEANNQNALNLNLKFTDVDISGISKVLIDRAVGFTADPRKSKFEIYGILPALEMKGQYTANGRILILPIQGKGDAFISITNCKVSIKFKPTIMEKNGRIFLGVKQLKVLLEPTNMKTRLDNLFNGDKALGENLNLFINENWSDVWSELAPNINKAMAGILKNLISEVFQQITYDEFYA